MIYEQVKLLSIKISF